MSRDSVEASFMKAALRHSGYATKTKVRMCTTYLALSDVAKAGRWGECAPTKLTEKQLARFVETRRGQVSARAVQNEMSHIRAALRGAEGRRLAGGHVNKMNAMALTDQLCDGTAHAQFLIVRMRTDYEER